MDATLSPFSALNSAVNPNESGHRAQDNNNIRRQEESVIVLHYGQANYVAQTI